MLKLKMWSHNLNLKLRKSITSFLDRDHIIAIRDDEAKLDALLHYPIKPAAIPLVSVDSLYDRHKSKIIQIENNIGLVKVGSKYNSKEMVEDILKNFIGYCHLFPASEMDHHQYVGGLLEHSLDVSLRSLQSAIGSMLDEQGLIDEDQIRRPRYEYAAWLCGLLHDAGKIISNLQIIEPKTGQQWQPLHSNLIDWGQNKSFSEYTVLHNKNRIHNEHETNSIHFLSLILNDTTKDYLLSGPDDLYSKITQTLIGYHSNKGYLHNAVRLADGASTYNDYARVWRHDSHRDKSMVTAVVDVLRSLYFDWTVNTPNAQMFILNGEIYLDMNKPIKAVINKCQELRIAVPNSPKSLIEILIDKRIIGKVSDKSTFGNFYCGKFSEEDVHQFNEHKTGALASVSPKSVVKFVWANFAIGDNPIPDNAKGALRYNTKNQDNVHTLFNGDKTTVVNQRITPPPSSEEVPKASNGQNSQSSSTEESPKTAGNAPLDTDKQLPVATKVKTRRSRTKKMNEEDTSPPPTADPKQPNSPTTCTQSTSLTSADQSKDKVDETISTKFKSPNNGASVTPNDGIEASRSTTNTKVPTWVSKRTVKSVDLALWELVSNQDLANVTMVSGYVAVSTKYLIEQTQQPIKLIIQEMEYLGLLNVTPVNFPKKINMNGIQSKVIALSQPVSEAFAYLNSTSNTGLVDVELKQQSQPIKVESTQLDSAPVVSNPQQDEIRFESPLDVAQEQTIDDEIAAMTTPLPNIDNEQPKISHQLPDESMYLNQPLSIFVTALQEDFPGVSASSLRPYLKTLKIKPTMSEGGTLMVQTTQTQRDELQYKIQKGITDDE